MAVDRTLGEIIREALDTAPLQILPECIVGAQLTKPQGKSQTRYTRVTFLTETSNLTPGEVLDPETAQHVGVVVWVPRAIYEGK